MSRYPPRRISLLVRNLPLDARPEELRTMFERYGDVRDVYLPRDYYTDRPRGFGFVEFLDGRDAEEAMYHLDGVNYGGRDISVVMSKESRKTPSEMYNKERTRGGGGRRRYRTPDRRRSYSRSPSPYRRRHHSRSRSRGYGGRYHDRHSRSPLRHGRRYYRRSGSPARHGRQEESPYSDERRHKNDREDDRRRRESKSPQRYRSNRRASESKSPRSEEKRSTYSSSPRSRSRTPEDKNGASRGGDDNMEEEDNPEGKKNSLSPQSGRRDGEDLFHPTAAQAQDY